MPDWLTWSELDAWILPLAFILVGALLGWGLERLIVPRLRKLTSRTKADWDDVLLHSLQHAPSVVLTGIGAYAASQLLPVEETVRRLLGQALMVLIVLGISLFAARAAGEAIRRWARRTGAFVAGTGLVTGITKVVILALGALIILQNLGIDIGPILGAVGISSLAVALALQPTLANAFAGFQIIATRQVRNGDYVKLETGEEGYVVDIRWRNTTIRALYEDHFVIVPNSKLVDAILLNYNLPRRPIWVRIPVGVSYRSDLRRVEEVSLDVAREVWKEFSSPDNTEEPVLRYKEFGDSAITFQMRIMVEQFSDQFPAQHEFVKRLHRRFGEEGIVIPWPIRTLDFPEAVRVSLERTGAPPGAVAPGRGDPEGADRAGDGGEGA